jgi:hypothetical protein
MEQGYQQIAAVAEIPGRVYLKMTILQLVSVAVRSTQWALADGAR